MKYSQDQLLRINLIDKIAASQGDFFSEEVQKILTDLGYVNEAEFTEHIPNWFRACDEQGMDVVERLTFLQDMYDYLLDKVSLSEYPPPVGISRGYTDYHQGRGHSIRPTAALINIHEHLI